MQHEKTEQVTVLEIWETRNGFALRILEPGEFLQTSRPVITESTMRVNQDTLKGLCNKMESISQLPGASVEDYKACGRALYDQLFGSLDQGIKTRLSSINTPLLISSRESDIVWELLHDGEDFWGKKYLLGRQIRAGVESPVLPTKPAPSRCLVVANPSCEERFKVLEEQAQSLIRHLRSLGIECRYLARGQATPEEVLMELSNGSYDIFHFTGHAARINEAGSLVERDDQGDCALQLAGGWLRSFEIERAAQGVSLVFLNGCQSASNVESLSNAFLLKGANLVVGTAFKVSAFGAQVFAETFYQNALAGKIVGEAFRAARIISQENAACYNAWASFVMYGNPCLKIIGATLPTQLRKNFDGSCRKVIENCVRYSNEAGMVCSPFLFAAMIDGEDSTLRDRLHQQGISTEKLRQLFEIAQTDYGDSPEGGTLLEVSENVLEIILSAEQEAKSNGRQNISEKDLLTGFVRQGGGLIGKLLSSSGIELTDVVGGKSEVTSYYDAFFKQAEFNSDAWAIIDQTFENARRCQNDVAGSAHLFLALLKNPPVELSQFLINKNIQEAVLIQALEAAMGIGKRLSESTRVQPSTTVIKIIQIALAKASKNSEKVTSLDLLYGFAQQGGGNMGELLRKQIGLNLLLMFSELNEDLCKDAEEKLDTGAGIILKAARDYAVQMGWKYLTTPHLFMGLCSFDGLTVDLIKKQGFNSKGILNIMRKSFTVSTPSIEGVVGNLLPMSERLQKIMSVAKLLIEADGSELVSEKHLLNALLQVGTGETGKVLQAIGLEFSLSDKASNIPENSALSNKEEVALIDKIGRDLTKEARAGRLRQVIGREREIERLQTILLRSSKNSPLLIGKAGVGKTAVVEGLAQRIAAGTVAEQFRDIRIVELPVGSLVAGTTFRGDFEARMEKVIKEAAQKGIILFIDELHTIVGAGASGSGSLDAANILKPFLARGEVRCIGATTSDEYQRLIEPDSALARRFQIINVEEPSQDESLAFLEGLRSDYEKSMSIKITDDALKSAVKLAVRYIPERCLPDKAIDLLEEACALVRLRSSGRTVTIDSREIREALQQLVPGLQTGAIEVDEQNTLFELENTLAKQVVGRKEAISSVAMTLRVARTNLRDTERPSAVFLFAGPSGVGKTHLALELALAVFGSSDAILRLDMTEFKERHSISKLLGAPPGYVGYSEESRLGVLRRRPRTVVLLDEADKACSEVFNVFLQLFDTGRISDARGRVIDGRQALFIITANCGIGATTSGRMGFHSEEQSNNGNFKKETMERVRHVFPREFLNRVDETIIFSPLLEEDLWEIGRRHLADLSDQIQLEQDFRVVFDNSVLEYLIGKCDKAQGARDLLKTIEVEIKYPLSLQIINGVCSSLHISASETKIKILDALDGLV